LLLSVSIVVVGSPLCGREPSATPDPAKIMLYHAALHKKIREHGVARGVRPLASIVGS